MVDYRKFLAKAETKVLPHFGGIDVEDRDRRLRLERSVAAGWWRFSIEGRKAQALESVEPDLDLLQSLPIVRGHWAVERLIGEGARPELLWFLPGEELPRFALVRARRWPSGPLLFESLELEGEAEEAARTSFEDRRDLSNVSGVPATLRAAHAYASIARSARGRGIAVSALELKAGLGRNDVDRFLDELVVARSEEARRQTEEARVAMARERARAVEAQRALSGTTLEDDVSGALRKAGAELLDLRRIQDGLVEVVFRFLGERFIAIVEASVLRVVDFGICLSGHDDELTLESLPGVIREAIQEDALVITRHHA